ncbi:MAG: glycosyltransferase family 2 protein [Elusimicrobia bacterium]|nr:glycosyltransferase family 2 protein [Elusimicrobiota bacterium]
MTTSAASLLSVVVPCYDEERDIPRFETELLAALESLDVPHELVAVDDGSTDETFAALTELAGRRGSVHVVRHPANRGLGAALRTGFAAAKGDWIATLDADLTFHPSQLRGLLECQRRTGADLVSGSPFLSAEGCSQVPWFRRLPSLAVNGLYRTFFHGGFTSYTPVLRLYRAELLKNLKFLSSGFEINAEIAARFILAGHRVAETAVTLSSRRHGASKLRPLRELARHARLIARLLAGR